MLRKQIDKFVRELCNRVQDSGTRPLKMPALLSMEMHQRGLNMRHLGLTRSRLTQQLVYLASNNQEPTDYRFPDLFLVEILARTLKNMLRQAMRVSLAELDEPSDFACKQQIVAFLNCVTGHSTPSPSSPASPATALPASAAPVSSALTAAAGEFAAVVKPADASDEQLQFWANVKHGVETRFGACAAPESAAELRKFAQRPDRVRAILRYVLKETGLQLTAECASQFESTQVLRSLCPELKCFAESG